MSWLTWRIFAALQSIALGTQRALQREDGQGLTEYALIIALIAVVVVGAVVLLGNQIANVFHSITNSLSNA